MSAASHIPKQFQQSSRTQHYVLGEAAVDALAVQTSTIKLLLLLLLFLL